MKKNNLKKVFVAGPYTKGDVAVNVSNAIKVADEIAFKGFIPHIPLLYHFWHLIVPHTWDYWMKLDTEWLKVCDCVLRIEGESIGADREVALAKRLGIPVFYSIEQMETEL